MDKEKQYVGRVKFHRSGQGWGIIKVKDGSMRGIEVYFNNYALLTPLTLLADGAKVTCRVIQHKRGLRAIDVRELKEEL